MSAVRVLLMGYGRMGRLVESLAPEAGVDLTRREREVAVVDAGHEVERLAHFEPTRQHGNVCDEANVVHEAIAFAAGIESEHLEVALE